MSIPEFIGVIPARKGSKRLLNKNLLDLAGLPLIGWTIKAAQSSESISKVVVSSDCEQILEISSSLNADYLHKRAYHLSTDEASSVDVVLDVLLHHQAKNIVLLQPTSPLRSASHIDAAIKLFKSVNQNIVSISERPNNFDVKFPIQFDASTLRVKIPPKDSHNDYTHQLNGAIYIISSSKLNKEKAFIDENTRGFVMDNNCSIDIDFQEDLDMARKLACT